MDKIAPAVTDRVARAIFAEERPDDSYELFQKNSGNPGKYERMARAAIEATPGPNNLGNKALVLLSRWENIAKNGGEKWLRDHPLVAETTDLLNAEEALSHVHEDRQTTSSLSSKDGQ